MAGRGNETLPGGRIVLGGPPGVLGGFGRVPFRWPGFGSPHKRAGRSRKALPKGREGSEAYPECCEGSGGILKGQAERDGRSCEAVLVGWNGSGGLNEGRGWKAPRSVWEELGGPPSGPGVVGRPSRRDRRGWKTLSES